MIFEMHLVFACLTHSPFSILNIAMSCKAQCAFHSVGSISCYIVAVSFFYSSSSIILLLNRREVSLFLLFFRWLFAYLCSVTYFCRFFFGIVWCIQWWLSTIYIWKYKRSKPIIIEFCLSPWFASKEMQKNVKPFYSLN